jgi:hypothetical protein
MLPRLDRLSLVNPPPSIGVILPKEAPCMTTCGICFENLYICVPNSGEIEAMEEADWPDCLEDQWRVDHNRPLVVLEACGEIFHAECIALNTWYYGRAKCPLCQKVFRGEVSLPATPRPNTLNKPTGVVPITAIGWYEAGCLQRRTIPDVRIEFYEGTVAGEERLERILMSNGVEVFLEGSRGKEHLLRGAFPNGDVEHYDGVSGAERLRRVVKVGGDVEHYDGVRGAEWLRRVVKVGGVVKHYGGVRGAERLMWVEKVGGDVETYEGARGAERMVNVSRNSRVVG